MPVRSVVVAVLLLAAAVVFAAWLLAAVIANLRRFWILKDRQPIPLESAQRLPTFDGPWVKRHIWQQPWPDPTQPVPELTSNQATLYAHAAMSRANVRRRLGVLIVSLAGAFFGVVLGWQISAFSSSFPDPPPLQPAILTGFAALIVGTGVGMSDRTATYWAHVATEYAACARRLRRSTSARPIHARHRPLADRLQAAWHAFTGHNDRPFVESRTSNP